MAVIERAHLELIRAVSVHGSLTAAAKQLHLTQSALSHAVRRLEDQLGLGIWRRDGRRVRLTEAGEYLLAVANRLLPQFEHTEDRLGRFASGECGSLRIGMECHPCHQWLLTIVAPYLAAWPEVDVDVKQKFQFGGIGALFGYEIDLLVTPDPLDRPGLIFQAVFDYEQVLVVGPDHPLRQTAFVMPTQMADETLLTYPVAADRLDIYSRFLAPAGIRPKRHKTIESTEIMLQMVASGRGVAALPRWLVEDQSTKFDVHAIRLGPQGLRKQIFLGFRAEDATIDYLRAFVELARGHHERA